MLSFVLITALLLGLCLALLLPSLWRDARRTAIVLLLLLPMAVLVLYARKGRPEFLAMDAAVPTSPAPATEAAAGSMDEAIARLRQRLLAEPQDVDGWRLLGRSHMRQAQFPQAREAFANAHALQPDDAELMVDYAEAQMRAWPGDGFPPAAAALLERALVASPAQPRALFILGLHRASAGRAAEALALWQQLLPQLDAAQAAQLRAQMQELRLTAKLPAAEGATAASGPEAAHPVGAAAGPTLSVEVAIDAALAAHVAPGDVLFVLARTADGAGPPAAVRRLATGVFPLRVELSDQDSMLPTLKLSGQSSVLVSARISKRGSAAPAPGDIESAAVPARPGSDDVIRLRLSRLRQ